MSGIRPIPGDPSAERVAAITDVDQTWAVTAAGDYESFAVEAFNRDGGDYDRLIAIRWPARLNKTDEHVSIRILMHPEDAVGLAEVLVHTARWMRAAEQLNK